MTKMSSNSGFSGQSVMGAGPPLIEERLDLALVGGSIHSLRKAAGEPDVAKLVPPSKEVMDDYRMALAQTAALKNPPDEATARKIRDRVRPLQKALTQAV